MNKMDLHLPHSCETKTLQSQKIYAQTQARYFADSISA
nr:MAG TPA: hypothetical protein [Caudoviricetes sp.]